MTLEHALAIYIQVADLNPLGVRTEEERQAHIVACEVIRHEADKAVALFNANRAEGA